MNTAHDFTSRAEELKNAIVGWRRHFHSHPELSFDETETSRFIAQELTRMGCTNVTVGTMGRPVGVIADIEGGHAGRRVALRADIDALPVCEDTGLEFASQNPGVMHACGHDGHTAMLLGAAQMLAEVKDSLHGSVRLIFQTSEESAESYQGAHAVVNDGKALDGVDAIFGVHLWAPLENGVLGWKAGPMMACSDCWKLRITGKGGHGASPHEAHDPIAATGHIICDLQTFVSRELDPLKCAVLTIGMMKAGAAFNVIPSHVDLVGTARSFDPDVSLATEEFIRRIADNVAHAYRCEAELVYERNLPATINDPAMAELGRKVAAGIFGEDKVREITPTMGGEDFSFYLQRVPGSFFFIGMGSAEKGIVWPHHHPKFMIDEDVLAPGAAFEAACAWNFLNG